MSLFQYFASFAPPREFLPNLSIVTVVIPGPFRIRCSIQAFHLNFSEFHRDFGMFIFLKLTSFLTFLVDCIFYVCILQCGSALETTPHF